MAVSKTDYLGISTISGNRMTVSSNTLARSSFPHLIVSVSLQWLDKT